MWGNFCDCVMRGNAFDATYGFAGNCAIFDLVRIEGCPLCGSRKWCNYVNEAVYNKSNRRELFDQYQSCVRGLLRCLNANVTHPRVSIKHILWILGETKINPVFRSSD